MAIVKRKRTNPVRIKCILPIQHISLNPHLALAPKARFDSQFISRLYEATKVMTKDFAQCFIGLSGESLASQIPAKLCLDHAEGGFDVRAFVIPLIELFTVHLVVVKHSMPYVYLAGWFGILSEVDIRFDPFVLGYVEVRFV